MSAINLLIRNALKSSFLPSNTILPSRIRHLLFKTLPGPPATIAVLLNLEGQGGPGNPGSANRVFLGPGDDFAYTRGGRFHPENISANPRRHRKQADPAAFCPR